MPNRKSRRIISVQFWLHTVVQLLNSVSWQKQKKENSELRIQNRICLERPPMGYPQNSLFEEEQ